MRQEPTTGPMALYGRSETAALVIYAAVLDPQIREIILDSPPESHTKAETAEFLGILRAGDLPQNLALLYSRPISFISKIPPAFEWTRKLCEKLGAGDRIGAIKHMREGRPQRD